MVSLYFHRATHAAAMPAAALIAVLFAVTLHTTAAHDWIGVENQPDCACKGVVLNCTNPARVEAAFDTLEQRKCNDTTTTAGETHPKCHLDADCQDAYYTVIAHRYGEFHQLQLLLQLLHMHACSR